MKHNKVILGITVVVMVILVVVLISGCGSNNKGTVIENVSKALETKDPKLLLSTMPKDKQAYPFAEDAAAEFIKEYAEIKDLAIQVLDEENEDVPNSVKEMRLSGEIPYKITKSGKSSDYVLLPNETKITLKDVDQDVQIKVNDKDVTMEEFQNPFLPGSYMIEATKAYQWRSITDKVTVSTGDKAQVEVSFKLDGHCMDLSKELKGAEILFKGEKTGVKIGDPESAQFGPFDEKDEKEIQLLGTFSWGETKSSNYDPTYFTIGSGSHFVFKPDVTAANELYVQFAKEYAEASVKLSVEPFTITTEKFNLAQADHYKPSLFGHEKYQLLKTYFNKEIAKITIDKDGHPIMQVEGIILFKHLKGAYIREKDVAHEISIKALYDDNLKKWKVDEARDSSYGTLPNQNEEGKYIITSAD